MSLTAGYLDCVQHSFTFLTPSLCSLSLYRHEQSDAESVIVPQSTTVPWDPSWESDEQWLEMAVYREDDEKVVEKMRASFAKYKEARLYWTDQRLYEHLLEARGHVDGRAKSTNLEVSRVDSSRSSLQSTSTDLEYIFHLITVQAAMATYFSRHGIIHVGDDRCQGCRDLVFSPKKKNKKGVPGLLLQCKQTAANKRCAQCAASGVPCTLDRSNTDSIKVSCTVPVHAMRVHKEIEKAVVIVEKVYGVLVDDDTRAIFSIAEFEDLRKGLDKAMRASNRLDAAAKGVDEVFVENYDPHYATDNNGRKVKLWLLVGRQ